ncbi:MAG: hypothetical protein IPG67_11560 [Acidobacteria bacterium]|nr:hypothetical protein [Acidobacteriota bacterium]
MKNRNLTYAFAVAVIIASFSFAGHGQSAKRTITKTDRFDFGAGGTVSVIGAPNGSIKITGGAKNEIEINATIQIEAPTEADLNLLAMVTTFILQEATERSRSSVPGPITNSATKKHGRNSLRPCSDSRLGSIM